MMSACKGKIKMGNVEYDNRLDVPFVALFEGIMLRRLCLCLVGSCYYYVEAEACNVAYA